MLCFCWNFPCTADESFGWLWCANGSSTACSPETALAANFPNSLVSVTSLCFYDFTTSHLLATPAALEGMI